MPSELFQKESKKPIPPSSDNEESTTQESLNTVTKHFDDTREAKFKIQTPHWFLQKYQNEYEQTKEHLSFRIDQEDSPLELRYGEEVAQVPVITALFLKEESEQELDAETFRQRPNHGVNLAFMIKSTPPYFGPYQVLLDHSLVRESGEELLRTYTYENLPTFEIQRFSLGGALPGLNLFRLRIQYTNQAGVTTQSQGIYHLTKIHEVGLFNIKAQCSVSNQKQKIRQHFFYQTELETSVDFFVSEAFDPAFLTLHLKQKTENRETWHNVHQEIREPLLKAFQNRSQEQTLSEVPLVANEVMKTQKKERKTHSVYLPREILKLEKLDNRHYRVSFKHTFSISEKLMPFFQASDYQLELHHQKYMSPIESIPFYVRIKGEKAGQDQNPVFLECGFEQEAFKSFPFIDSGTFTTTGHSSK